MIATLTLCASPPAHAQSVASIGVESDSPDNPARAKVIEELRAQGYDVRDMVKETSGGPPLSARLTVQGRRIDVRVVVRRNGQYESREAVIQLGQTDDEQTTAALRAAEFLRVSLLDLGANAPEPAAQRSPPLLPFEDKAPQPKPRPAAPAPAPERKSSLALSTGMALGASTGGFGMQPWAVLGLSFPASRSLRARVSGLIPVSSVSRTMPAGEVELSTTMIGPSLEWIALMRPWIEVSLEAGVSIVSSGISAHANPGYTSESSRRYSAMPLAGIRVLALPGRFRLGLAGFAGTMLPREEVLAHGDKAATWGELVGGGMLTADVGID